MDPMVDDGTASHPGDVAGSSIFATSLNTVLVGSSSASNHNVLAVDDGDADGERKGWTRQSLTDYGGTSSTTLRSSSDDALGPSFERPGCFQNGESNNSSRTKRHGKSREHCDHGSPPPPPPPPPRSPRPTSLQDRIHLGDGNSSPDLPKSAMATPRSSSESVAVSLRVSPSNGNGVAEGATAGASSAMASVPKGSCDCNSRTCKMRDSILLPFCLMTSALFGVGARYGLEALFMKNMENVTSEWSPIFIDLPPNMVGCFVMGFVSFAWKKHLTWWSEDAALFLTTGFCGCLTTFASWNQRVTAMFVAGLWVRGLLGVLFGFELAFSSLIIGKDAGNAFMVLLERRHQKRLGAKPIAIAPKGIKLLPAALPYPSVDNCRRKFLHLTFYVICWSLITIGSIIGSMMDTRTLERRKLWIALTVCAPGVLLRWRLATLNRPCAATAQNKFARRFEWLPLGTFVANMLATVLAAMLSGLSFELSTSSFVKPMATSLQIGFLGCLSTVSTLMLEVYNLRMAPRKQYRAYIYMMATSFLGIALSALIYGVPVWIYDYPAAHPSRLSIGYT